MKVNLNLSLSQSFRQRHAVAWSVPALILGLALLVRIVLSIQSDWSRYRSERHTAEIEANQLNELAAREADLRKQLNLPQNRKLLRSVEFVNDLIQQRQLSFSEVTDQLISLMPPQVRLITLSVPDFTGEPVLHLGIEGGSEAPVETFLSHLEDSPAFTDVTVTSQGFEEKGNGAPVSISCTVRYTGARPAAPSREAGRHAGAAEVRF
jgi:Tfp pilus assembly protein PilN